MYSLRSTKLYKGQRSVGILGGETAKQNLPSAELRDGIRPCVLALKSHAVLHMQSCGAAALFEYFEYFVVSKIYMQSCGVATSFCA